MTITTKNLCTPSATYTAGDDTKVIDDKLGLGGKISVCKNDTWLFHLSAAGFTYETKCTTYVTGEAAISMMGGLYLINGKTAVLINTPVATAPPTLYDTSRSPKDTYLSSSIKCADPAEYLFPGYLWLNKSATETTTNIVYECGLATSVTAYKAVTYKDVKLF